jgi:hypothetical protein
VYEYIHIYIYIERERKRERGSSCTERDKERDTCLLREIDGSPIDKLLGCLNIERRAFLFSRADGGALVFS